MFSNDTYQYFDQAHKNKCQENWFEEHSDQYKCHVKKPFEELLSFLSLSFSQDLPVNEKKISRPKRPKNRHQDKGIVKDFSSVIMSEPKHSRFEHPPCLHIQLGALPSDNFICVGMYLENSKQLKKIRQNIDSEFATLIETTSKSWGPLRGKKYKRLPQGLDPEFQELNQFKTFYFQRDFSRLEVTSDKFPQMVHSLIESGLPFYQKLNAIVL